MRALLILRYLMVHMPTLSREYGISAICGALLRLALRYRSVTLVELLVGLEVRQDAQKMSSTSPTARRSPARRL